MLKKRKAVYQIMSNCHSYKSFYWKKCIGLIEWEMKQTYCLTEMVLKVTKDLVQRGKDILLQPL